MTQVALAGLHLIALAIGLPAVLVRAWSLGRAATRDAADRVDALRRAFGADSLWGAAAAIWIGTGLWRWLAGTEKSTEYYNRNHLFLAKMGFLVLILLMEIWPMVKLIGWRVSLKRGATLEAMGVPDTGRRLAVVSYVQAALVLAMVFLASAMARGLGAMPGG